MEETRKLAPIKIHSDSIKELAVKCVMVHTMDSVIDTEHCKRNILIMFLGITESILSNLGEVAETRASGHLCCGINERPNTLGELRL